MALNTTVLIIMEMHICLFNLREPWNPGGDNALLTRTMLPQNTEA